MTNIEGIRFSHNICLCYSETMGLYVSDVLHAPKDEVLFIAHGDKGFWKKQVELEDMNMTIRLETNFGYGNRTYMRAIIERAGKKLLDFDQSKMYILNNCSIMTVDVEPHDWEKLFKKIISISKEFNPNKCPLSAISYIEELNSLLNKKEILIKGSYISDFPTKWRGEYIVLLFLAQKIRDLIKGYNAAKVTDEVFANKCLQLYNNFLQKIKVIDIDLSDKRTSQFAEALFMIHEIMIKNELGCNFLSHFISKSK